MSKNTLEGLWKDCERVAKKQKTATKTIDAGCTSILDDIDKCIDELNTLMDTDSSNGNVHGSLLELANSLQATGNARSKMQTEQKEMHSEISRLRRNIDATLNVDLSKVTRPAKFDKMLLNEVIAQHLFRQGRFELGEKFVKESNHSFPEVLKEPFIEMYKVLEAIKKQDLGPALEWAAQKREALEKKGSSLEFKLHRLQFMGLLRDGKKEEALRYSRTAFPRFSTSQMAEIQRLMACFLWMGRLEESPYAHLMAQTHWQDVQHAFTRECCSLLGMSYESPLYVSVMAGYTALPTLLKLANVMSGKNSDWSSADQLPVEIDLGRDCQYHSIFSCPVSRETSSEDNPPMLLPCGHVLNHQSLLKLAHGTTRFRFKCPYCPHECTPAVCTKISF